MSGDAEKPELVSIAEAARRLQAQGDQVDRSTLSRYLKQHGEALPLTLAGKESLVDFAALVSHRSENVRIRQVRDDIRGTDAIGRRAVDRRFAGSQSEGTARKVQADADRARSEAEMRAMDLAQRRGQLTSTAEVERAGHDAVALMRSAFEQVVETEAADASVKYGWDERMARIVLKRFAKQGLDRFHRELLARLPKPPTTEIETSQEATPQ